MLRSPEHSRKVHGGGLVAEAVFPKRLAQSLTSDDIGANKLTCEPRRNLHIQSRIARRTRNLRALPFERPPPAMKNDTDRDTCPSGPRDDDLWGRSNPRDTRIQIYISLALGAAAFLTFCVSLRLRKEDCVPG